MTFDQHDQTCEDNTLAGVGDSGSSGSSEGLFMEYDEDGSLTLARALSYADNFGAAGATSDTAKKPCAVSQLDGSWFLQFRQSGPHTLREIRGAMRIEVAPPKLRISGDIYVRQPLSTGGPIEILPPITENALLFGQNWYPQFPIDQYAWYFRSLGVTYNLGALVFKFERKLWNKTTKDFISESNGTDQGILQLECFESNVFNHPALPQPTLRLTGSAQIGGVTYDVVATKTSPFYRGCAVEVDVMTNRSFPLSVTTVGGTVVDFTSVYRTAGIDCAVTIDQTSLPEDVESTTTELQTALFSNRTSNAAADAAWRLWLFISSQQGDQFGLMFDDIEPFREGIAGFFDANLGDDPVLAPTALNQKVGDVPAAFLRTLVHEAGHAFNLCHPREDVHVVPLGKTIMNQTGDVMYFATATHNFPDNIIFAFEDHQRTSLIHSSDPQVRPGWKHFGYGHASLGTGTADPTDAAGFLRHEPTADNLVLSLTLPQVVFRGQFVTAQFQLTNTGSQPRRVTSAINLSRGDLRLLLKPPNQELSDVRDVIIGCGDRPLTTLAPGESLRGSGQIFYTNYGFTFRHTGRFYVSAELNVGDSLGSTARSSPVAIVVRAPVKPEEEKIALLSMEPGVGRAFAFGDYGTDEKARACLEELADKYGHTETGVAAALTLANAKSRNLRDLYTGNILRAANGQAAEAHFAAATASKASKDPRKLVHLAAAVAAATESNVPIFELTADYLKPAAGPGWHVGDSNDSTSAAKADALNLLGDLRRSFAGRK